MAILKNDVSSERKACDEGLNVTFGSLHRMLLCSGLLAERVGRKKGDFPEFTIFGCLMRHQPVFAPTAVGYQGHAEFAGGLHFLDDQTLHLFALIHRH